METNQINSHKNSKEAYCPNSFFDNGTISIGEFKTLDDAMNFPIKGIWCINRTQDNKFNSYASQGCRLLIICDWNKSIQDSQKFVVALISKSGKITYWDLNDLPINTKQYENSIDNDVLTAIFAVADELYRNNNQLNCNTNMNKKLIRLNESDLHRIVKESVKKVLRENTNDDIYSDIDGKIKTVETYLSLEDYVWNWWDLYEEALGEPLWPLDERGQREGAKRLLRVLKSMKGEDNYLQNYGDWTGNDREYSRTDNQTWGEYYRNNLDKMANYNG